MPHQTLSKTHTKPLYNININENQDVLIEILKRLDGRSLAVAACVCRQWSSLATSDDSIWEHICFRHVSPPRVRALVLALGGYKRLYMECVRPVITSIQCNNVGQKRARSELGSESELSRRVWTRQGAQLLLSLFCVDYYEKLGGGPNVGPAFGNDSTSSGGSLMFLCKPVNV